MVGGGVDWGGGRGCGDGDSDLSLQPRSHSQFRAELSAGCLLMFVREKAKGGADRAFLPDIELFSVQVRALNQLSNINFQSLTP